MNGCSRSSYYSIVRRSLSTPTISVFGTADNKSRFRCLWFWFVPCTHFVAIRWHQYAIRTISGAVFQLDPKSLWTTQYSAFFALFIFIPISTQYRLRRRLIRSWRYNLLCRVIYALDIWIRNVAATFEIQFSIMTHLMAKALFRPQDRWRLWFAYFSYRHALPLKIFTAPSLRYIKLSFGGFFKPGIYCSQYNWLLKTLSWIDGSTLPLHYHYFSNIFNEFKALLYLLVKRGLDLSPGLIWPSVVSLLFCRRPEAKATGLYNWRW